MGLEKIKALTNSSSLADIATELDGSLDATNFDSTFINDLNSGTIPPNETVTPKKTTFFDVTVNLATLYVPTYSKTIAYYGGYFQAIDSEDETSYVIEYIDVSDVPTGKMIVVRGVSSTKFITYDSAKGYLAGKDINRVYYKEADVDYISITNTDASGIESEVYALGENANEFFKEDYDKYTDWVDSTNIFNNLKAVFGYYILGTTLTHTFTVNKWVYGYIDIEGQTDIYLYTSVGTYKVFNALFYDSSYTLIKGVQDITSYDISGDATLATAKYMLISPVDSYTTSDKEDILDVIVSFTEIIGYPTYRMIDYDKVDKRYILDNKWVGKTFDSLGDSLTERGYFQESIKERLALSEFYNNGIGSTAMAGTGTTAGWQDVRIADLNADIDLLVMMFGTNDNPSNAIGTIALTNIDTTTFVGAYNVCLAKIYDKYSNDILILLMTPFYNDNGNDNTLYAEAVIEIGKLWHIPVVDMFNLCGINDYNADQFFDVGDSTHPLETAYESRISPILLNAIKEIEPIA